MPDDELDLEPDLAEIADIVRRRPSESFRASLLLDLERNHPMPAVDMDVARPSGISYLHIPSRDQRASGEFYAAVFDWELRGDPDAPSFTDGTGHVIGAWVTDIEPVGDAGVLPYVFVESVDDTLARATTAGADVVREPYPEGDLLVATFRDPSGNVVGVWQMGHDRRR